MSSAAKNFDILATSLSVLHHFDNLTNLLFLYPAKISEFLLSAKSFFFVYKCNSQENYKNEK